MNVIPHIRNRKNYDSGELEFLPDLSRSTSVIHLLLLVELSILILELSGSHDFSIDWQSVGVRSLFVQMLVLSNFLLMRLFLTLFYKTHLVWITLFALVIAGSTTLLVSILSQVAFPGVFASGPIWLARNVFIALLLASILLRYFYILHRVTLLERSSLEARLDSLRARIRPHFLFNALNSIASLIYSDQKKAEEAIEGLASLFRSSLRTSDQFETVAEEIDRCKLYLAIETLRLGERLKVEWIVDENVLSLPMPGMILQPLVENSVYHGISQLPEGGLIIVRLGLLDSKVALSIENPIERNKVSHSGLNIALENIIQRLIAMYAGSMNFSTSIKAGKFLVCLQYPSESL